MYKDISKRIGMDTSQDYRKKERKKERKRERERRIRDIVWCVSV